MYTIGQVTEMFGLPTSTLRYYDKQGLFPGMEIKDIRLFMEWCAEGPSTYPQRKAMFEDRKAHMESEIANMNRALDMLKFKCWYYEQLNQGDNDAELKALIPDGLPAEIKEAYENAHAR